MQLELVISSEMSWIWNIYFGTDQSYLHFSESTTSHTWSAMNNHNHW